MAGRQSGNLIVWQCCGVVELSFGTVAEWQGALRQVGIWAGRQEGKEAVWQGWSATL